MNKRARKHHYVPAFYLAGFTESGDREDVLCVTDTLEARQFFGKPASVGFENDYFLVDHPDLQPADVEKVLASIEGETAPALHRLRETRDLPSETELHVVLNLIALLAARVPGVRRAFEDPLTRVGEDLLTLFLEDPERWERFVEQQAAKGEDVSRYPSFEEIKEAWETGGVELSINPSWFPLQTLRIGALIFELLTRRSWSLLLADVQETQGFVTSDRPVSLYWTVPVPPFYGPGFGLRDTEVLFPVDRSLALVGRFDSDPEVIQATPVKIGFVNAHTTKVCERFVYSATEEFTLLLEDGRLGGSQDLLRAVEGRTEEAAEDEVGEE